MKIKHLIIACALLFAAGCEPASETTTANSSDDVTTANAATVTVTVPEPTRTEFTTRYPSATGIEWAHYKATDVPIDWDLVGWPAMQSDDYVVRYNLDGAPSFAYYDNTGAWIGSTTVMNDFTKLPAAVQKTLSDKYAGYTIAQVHQETWKDQMGYEIEMKNADNKVKIIVDPNGNILKEKAKVK